MRTILLKRNQEIFVTPMDPREVENSVAKSVIKKDYNYKCPPKLGAITIVTGKQKFLDFF